MQLSSLYYHVGGHLLQIVCNDITRIESSLPSFKDFKTSIRSNSPLIKLCITDEEQEAIGEERYRYYWEGCEFVFLKKENGYTMILSPDNNDCCFILDCMNGFREARIKLSGQIQLDAYILKNILMMLYAFASADRNTLLMHASVIEREGIGYLFLGKSGTGKSTHSRLWLNHIADTSLLNDDNPIVRIIDNEVFVFGSPWSGKTHCYRNLQCKLGGFVFLKQAPHNKISRIPLVLSFGKVLSSSSAMKWENKYHDAVCDTASKVAELSRIFSLECLPDEAAAQLCFQTLKADDGAK